MLCGKLAGHDVTVTWGDTEDGPSVILDICLASGKTLTFWHSLPKEEKGLLALPNGNEAEECRPQPSSINDTLPAEVLSKILEMASGSSLGVMRIVCSLVCRLWKQLYPPIDYLSYNFPAIKSSSFLVAIAEQGWLPLLMWAKAKGFGPWDSSVCTAAALGGHIEILKWALENQCCFDSRTTAAAAKGGHGEVLRWLREKGCPWDYVTFTHLVKTGDLELLKWAKERGCGWRSSAFEFAAKSGNIEVMEWLKDNGCPMDVTVVCVWAARSGKIEALEWCIANGCSLVHRDLDAVNAGNLEMLKWLIAKGCDTDSQYYSQLAAANGNLEMLTWLREHDYHFDNLVFAAAAKRGHIQVLKWLRKNGYQWEADACSSAASTGNLGALKWLRKKGCPWEYWTAQEAFYQSNKETFQWAVENGCEYGNLCNVYKKAALKSGNMVVLRWCHKVKMRFGSDSCKMAVTYGHLKVLKWLRGIGTPWSFFVWEEALEHQNLRILQWIHSHADTSFWA